MPACPTAAMVQCLKAPPGVVSCSDDELYNYAVLDCYCATYDIDKKLFQVGACFFNCGNNTKLTVDIIYHKVPKKGYDLNEGTEVLTLSAHNLEKMMATPYSQHSYLSSSVPVSQLHSIPTLKIAFEMNFEL